MVNLKHQKILKKRKTRFFCGEKTSTTTKKGVATAGWLSDPDFSARTQQSRNIWKSTFRTAGDTQKYLESIYNFVWRGSKAKYKTLRQPDKSIGFQRSEKKSEKELFVFLNFEYDYYLQNVSTQSQKYFLLCCRCGRRFCKPQSSLFWKQWLSVSSFESQNRARLLSYFLSVLNQIQIIIFRILPAAISTLGTVIPENLLGLDQS